MPLLPALREAGAEDFWLSITFHCDSGAIGFSKEEIKMITELQCDVPIDCMVEEEPTLHSQRPRAAWADLKRWGKDEARAELKICWRHLKVSPIKKAI